MGTPLIIYALVAYEFIFLYQSNSNNTYFMSCKELLNPQYRVIPPLIPDRLSGIDRRQVVTHLNKQH